MSRMPQQPQMQGQPQGQRPQDAAQAALMPPPSVLPPGLQDNPDAVWHRMLNDAEDSGNPDHVMTLMPLMASVEQRRQRETKWQGLTKAGIKPEQVADPDERLLMDSFLSAGNKHGYAREVARMHRAQDLVSQQAQPGAQP